MLEENYMAALIIRLPDGKRERLKDLARARKQSVTKLFGEMATVLLAEYDSETRFRVRAARGAGKIKRGLELLVKARGWGRACRACYARSPVGVRARIFLVLAHRGSY